MTLVTTARWWCRNPYRFASLVVAGPREARFRLGCQPVPPQQVVGKPQSVSHDLALTPDFLFGRVVRPRGAHFAWSFINTPCHPPCHCPSPLLPVGVGPFRPGRCLGCLVASSDGLPLSSTGSGRRSRIARPPFSVSEAFASHSPCDSATSISVEVEDSRSTSALAAELPRWSPEAQPRLVPDLLARDVRAVGVDLRPPFLPRVHREMVGVVLVLPSLPSWPNAFAGPRAGIASFSAGDGGTHPRGDAASVPRV